MIRREIREREREWKGEDWGRKGCIPEIITQEKDAKEGHERITRIGIQELLPSVSLHKIE